MHSAWETGDAFVGADALGGPETVGRDAFIAPQNTRPGG